MKKEGKEGKGGKRGRERNFINSREYYHDYSTTKLHNVVYKCRTMTDKKEEEYYHLNNVLNVLA